MRMTWLILPGLIVGMIPQLKGQMLTKEDLQRQIELYEKALAKNKASNPPTVQTGRIQLNLATLYQDAGQYERSEEAFEAAIRIFKKPPVTRLELAAAIDGLGTVYLQRGEVAEAERAELRALELREEAGQKPELAHSWYHLATLYLHKRRAGPARDYAERAVNELLSEDHAASDDKISALFALSLSLGLSHKYPEAIESLQDALRLVKTEYRANDFPTGFATFLLGYAHWKAGEPDTAGELMRQGTEIMGRQLGWWSPAYRSVMMQYARYLRSTRQKDTARSIEQKVQSARAEANANGGYRHNQETADVSTFF